MNEWTSVKECLPKEGVNVLTWNPDLAKRYHVEAGYDIHRLWLDREHDNWWIGYSKYTVDSTYAPTHWMPLPEPPKE